MNTEDPCLTQTVPYLNRDAAARAVKQRHYLSGHGPSGDASIEEHVPISPPEPVWPRVFPGL